MGRDLRVALFGAALTLAITIAARGGTGQTLGAQKFDGVLDEHPAIQYATRPTMDRVARVNRSLADGRAPLLAEPRSRYLRAVLDALEVPVETQLLIFSKTGVQRDEIGPRNPRAIFFDDEVAIGFVRGARYLEIAAHDPQQGVVFYVLDQDAPAAPAFFRRTTCLACHVSANTMEVPGLIARSNFMTAHGDVMPQLGSFEVTHRTPLAERWGGWFVTGDYEAPPYAGFGHMGNSTTSLNPVSGRVTTSNEVFIEWLNSVPETRGYPSAESDIAALMMFDHQRHAINLMTRLNWETRVATAGGFLDFARDPLRALVHELADYLLFVGEVAPPGKVTPRDGLATRFVDRGPRDRRGRSLRELDLETRLLRYPCSYMVYAAAFDGLPAGARTAVYERMATILSGRDRSPRYAHLTADLRRTIVEILRDTKTDLPASFTARAR
jgi:hypothetical protein